MAKAKKKTPFNVKIFLSTVDGGRTVSNYRKNDKVFSQGDPADSVFYVQEGKVKVCVISEQGKEAVVALHGKETSLARVPERPSVAPGDGGRGDGLRYHAAEKAAIVRVLHDEPKFSEMFMSYLLLRTPASRKIWSISFSIRVRSGWRGCSY